MANLTKTLTLKVDGVSAAINSVEELNDALLQVDSNADIKLDLDTDATVEDLKNIQSALSNIETKSKSSLASVKKDLEGAVSSKSLSRLKEFADGGQDIRDKFSKFELTVITTQAKKRVQELEKEIEAASKNKKIKIDVSAQTKELENLKKQLKEVEGDGKKAGAGLSDFTSALGAVGGGEVAGGIESAAGGLNQVKGLLSKLPPQAAIAVAAIGALAAPLAAFFTSTKEGQNDIKVFFGGVTGAFKGLVKSLASFGKDIKALFSGDSSPIIASLKQFGLSALNIIVGISTSIDNVGSLIAAKLFGSAEDVEEAQKKLSKSFKLIQDGFTEIFSESITGAGIGAEIAKLEIAFEQLELAVIKANGAIEGELAKVEAALGNENATLEDSLMLIDKRAKLQKQLLGNELQLANARLNIVNKSLTLDAADADLIREKGELEAQIAKASANLSAEETNRLNERLSKIKEARDIEIDGARATLDAKKDSIEKASLLNEISKDEAIKQIQDLDAADEKFYDDAIARLRADVEGRKASAADLQKANELEQQRKLKALEKEELISEVIIKNLDLQIAGIDRKVAALEKETNAIDKNADATQEAFDKTNDSIMESTESLNIFSKSRQALTIAEQKANLATQKAINETRKQEIARLKVAEDTFNTKLDGVQKELDALDEIRSKNGQLTTEEQARYDAAIGKIQDVTDEYNGAQGEIKKSADATVDGLQKGNEALKDGLKKTAEEIKAQRIATTNDIANAAVEIFDSVNQILNQQDEAALSRLEKRAEKAQELIDETNAKAEESKEQQEALTEQLADADEKSRARIIRQLDREARREERLQKQKVKQEAELKKINEEKRKIQKEQFQREKAANIIKAVINTALAVTAAASTQPYIPLGLIATALALATGTAAVATIASQPTPEFASGGFTGPGSKADKTGHKVAGIVHDGEWVAPKWMVSSAKYAPVIHEMESVRYRGFASGGFAGNTSSSTDFSAVIPQISETNRLIAASIDRPVVVSVLDINAAQSNNAAIVSSARL